METAWAWIRASQYPDLDPGKACGYFTDRFRNAFVEQWNAMPHIEALGMKVASCEEAIRKAADLQAAAGKSAEILTKTRVELVEQMPGHAKVRVSYSSGKCGLMMFERRGSGWAMNEQSKEGCD